MKINNNVLKFCSGIISMSRAFPYGRYLITVFPFFAVLIHNGLIISPRSFLLIIPFVTAMAAGFIYNTICDAQKDPKGKNIITRGDFSKNNAYVVLITSIIISLLIFWLTYTSKIALIFFIFYIFIWLGYSGLKIRFKETYLATIIASIVLWVGAPFILLIEFHYFDYSTIFLLLGLFVIYIGHEIKHTTIEHDIDKEYDCKTFAVRCGKKYASIIEYVSLIVGFLLLLTGSYYFEPSLIGFTLLFSILFSISLISTIWYGIKVGYNLHKDLIFITMPYIVTKTFIIAYGFMVLQLPIILVLFIIWIFFMDRYP